MNKFFNYKIPNRKKWLLTDAFLKTFKEELDIVFEFNKDKTAPTYNNAYIWLNGTGGLQKALKEASKRHNLNKAIYEYYCKLWWYESDMFDEEVFEIMLERNLIELGNPEDLCAGYPTKEELDEMEKNKKIEWVKMVTSHQGYSTIERDWVFSTPQEIQ